MYACMRVCVCMCVCICECVYVCVCMCVCIHFVGWLFGFHGISTLVGYLTPNSVYIYIYIYIYMYTYSTKDF